MPLDIVKNIFSTKITLNSLLKAVNQKDVKKIRQITSHFNEVDLAQWMSEISNNAQIFFMRSLDNLTASEILNHLDSEVVVNIINVFNKAETKELLSSLYSDDILELIEDLPSDLVTKILESSSKEQRKDINYILNYQDDTVGSEMNVDFVAIKINEKVSAIISQIAQAKKKITEDFQFYYVVDEKGVLIGYVSAQELLSFKDRDKLISAIVETGVISVRASDDKVKAVEKFNKYGLTQLPVVDLQNKLVGVLTGEQALQLLKEEYVDDINKQAGIVQDSDKKYFDISILKTYLGRIPWLFVTILISTISQIIFSFLLADFTNTEAKFLWFKFIFPFIPFILTIVGNVALQSTALVVKGLTLKEIEKRKYWSVLKKEISASFLILVTILVLNLPRTMLINKIVDVNFVIDSQFWKNLGQVSAIICIAIFLSVFLATSLPIGANHWGWDPALMSSPLLTTIIDLLVSGVAVGFSYLIYAFVS